VDVAKAIDEGEVTIEEMEEYIRELEKIQYRRRDFVLERSIEEGYDRYYLYDTPGRKRSEFIVYLVLVLIILNVIFTFIILGKI